MIAQNIDIVILVGKFILTCVILPNPMEGNWFAIDSYIQYEINRYC